MLTGRLPQRLQASPPPPKSLSPLPPEDWFAVQEQRQSLQAIHLLPQQRAIKRAAIGAAHPIPRGFPSTPVWPTGRGWVGQGRGDEVVVQIYRNSAEALGEGIGQPQPGEGRSPGATSDRPAGGPAPATQESGHPAAWNGPSSQGGCSQHRSVCLRVGAAALPSDGAGLSQPQRFTRSRTPGTPSTISPTSTWSVRLTNRPFSSTPGRLLISFSSPSGSLMPPANFTSSTRLP